MKARLVTVLLAVGLMVSGGSAVIAASGGSSSTDSAAKSQYCPPKSPVGSALERVGMGKKCGQPPPEDCDPDAPNNKNKDKCRKP